MTLVPTAESDELVRQSNLSHPRSPTRISANSPHGTNPARSLDDGESKDPSVMSSKRRLPLWVKEQLPGWGERFCLPEWDDDDDFFEGDELLNDKSEMNNEYRGNNGWKGKDLCHSSTAPVRISHYAVQYSGNDGVGTTITGVAHFTPHAESHAGFCHGGSMTSVMDDIIGWTAFHASGQCIPWSGFTAQINVTLKRPISVGLYLKIMGTITKREGRKVWVHAQLLVADACESEDGKDVVVHCTAEGLAILKRECA